MDATQDMTQNVAKRHRLSTRIWHWLNAFVATILLMSGLMIFNAHPHLYWGDFGSREDYAWLQIDDARTTGFVRIGSVRVETTGVLGLSLGTNDKVRRVAFPGWATIPTGYDLAAARRWHFAFAWAFALGLTAFMLVSLFNGHIRKDLHVRRAEWSFSAIWTDIKNHARLRLGQKHGLSNYNIIQKFSYIGVIFLLLPLLILTGITMSPAMNAAWPWLLDLLGGRQSARSLHFIAAFLLALFVVAHLIMVLLSGPINGIGSMIIGRPMTVSKPDQGGQLP
ncbi:cytochrome b/b6 domain-containing protein [Sphingorhabdus sp.]|jgi:thiosulfate reductase cytochrome b subunit|uniref:cytochrome b/b6 domain-containing protein n=1 Tax=Sphingorhabdus sp. TaxID=1902408 RepID=UPI0037C6850B